RYTRLVSDWSSDVCSSDLRNVMAEAVPVVLIPGLNCSARLYAEQIHALWRLGPVQVADHPRDDRMDAIATRILAAAPPRFAPAEIGRASCRERVRRSRGGA